MANRIQVRTSFAPSFRKAISLAVLLMLGACETTDKIVDTVNPTNWFSSEGEQTAQSAPPPADPNAEYPRIGPIEPVPPKPAIADDAAELRSSLIADKNNARYTDQVLRAQTEPAMREQQAAALSAAPPSPASIPQASPRTQTAAASSTATAAITPPPARATATAAGTTPVPVPVPVPVPTAVATASSSGGSSAAAPPAPVPVPVPVPAATQTTAPAAPATAQTPARAATPAPAPEPIATRPSPAPAPAPAPTPATNQTAALDRPSPPPQAASISTPPAAAAPVPVPAPAPAPAPAAVAQPKLIAHIFFGDGGATLSDADRDVLRQVVGIYRQSGGKGVMLVGHSSGRNGTRDALQGNLVNFKLSLDRATSVGSVLVGFGLPRDAVKVDARGASEPKYDESTQNGEAGNRRVDVFIEY